MSKNVFFTKFSALSGNRFDPKYNDYTTRYKIALNNSVKLGSLLIENPKYGANESAVNYNNNCRYIRITDINEFGLLKQDGLKSAEVEEEKYKLEVNDILFARSGATVGKAYIHKDSKLNAIFAGYMIRFRVDETKINPDYIFYYTQLNIYKQWIEAIQRSAGQPNINAEEYQDLDIAIPSINIQNNIISKMEEAYKLKEQKEKEAQNKLDSIDNYLLNELVIEVSSNEKENLEDRVFLRKFSGISGDRLDPTFHKSKFKEITKSIQRYNYVQVKDIVSFSSETWNQKNLFKDTFPYIEISEIDISSGNIKNINHIEINKAPSRAKMIIRNNDIIISTTRPNRGAISLVSTDDVLIASTGFAVIRNISNEIEREFLFKILKSSIILNQFDQRSSGGNYPAITQEEIGKVLIPLPSLKIQNNIIVHIKRLRDEAKSLKNEAIQIYEETKKEVEDMIFGDKL